MTTPLDPYAAASSNLPAAVASQIPGSIIGANNQTINTSELNVSSTGGGAVLGYAGTPGVGNLYFSLSVASGSDNYGNAIPTGIMASAGNLTGVSLVGVQMDSTSTLQNTQINGAQVLSPTIAGGTATSLVQTMTNTSGAVYGYSQGSTSITYATNGNYLWTCPTGVTSVNIQCWGAGAGGGGGGPTEGGESGGGGEYAAEPSWTVTPLQVYSIIVGQGGAGGSTNFPGSSGGATVFQSSSGGGNAVTANPGLAGGSYIGGNGGSGSTNTIHFDGGDGADGSGNTGAAGGASSGSANGEGNDGNESSSSTGAAGATPPSGGGAGGAGGNSASNGVNGSGPGGAGGGAGADTVVSSSKTYNPSGGTYAYRGSDATVSPNALLNHDGPMYQGYPNKEYGTQYSYWILPWQQIQSDMAGYTVTSVSMKIKCLYSYYSNGVWAEVYYTSLDSFGNTGDRTGGSPTFSSSFNIQQNQTLTHGLGGDIISALLDGAAKSIQFSSYPLTPAGDYYGSFDSGANNGVDPALIVDYNNGGGVTAGNGADGQVILSYGNTSTPTFQLSVSADAGEDIFGNPYSAGFTGPLLTLTSGSSTPATTTSDAVAVGASPGATSVVVTNDPGFTGTMAANTVDITTNIQTGTALTQALSKSYVIPTGDPQVGTLYRISAWGDFHSADSSQAALRWQLNVGGNSVATFILGGASMQASVFYEWQLNGFAQFVGIGAGGSPGTVNAYFNLNYGLYTTGTSNQGASPNEFNGACAATTGNVITISSGTSIQLMGSWAATESGQTVRCFGSMLERLGP